MVAALLKWWIVPKEAKTKDPPIVMPSQKARQRRRLKSRRCVSTNCQGIFASSQIKSAGQSARTGALRGCLDTCAGIQAAPQSTVTYFSLKHHLPAGKTRSGAVSEVKQLSCSSQGVQTWLLLFKGTLTMTVQANEGKLRVLGYDPGKTHRWAAWIDFLTFAKLPEWSGGVEIGPEREDVVAAIEAAFAGIERERCVVAVETPAGIPFGETKQEILARGRDVNATCLAAERFASIAWALGYRVEQLSAHEVRGGRTEGGRPVFAGLCLGKSATDPEVKAALEGNLRIVGRCNVHGRDAAAAGLVIGAWILGRKLQYGADLFRAKAAQKSKATVKTNRTKNSCGNGKLANVPDSVAKAMREQGHGHLIGKGIRVR